MGLELPISPESPQLIGSPSCQCGPEAPTHAEDTKIVWVYCYERVPNQVQLYKVTDDKHPP